MSHLDPASRALAAFNFALETTERAASRRTPEEMRKAVDKIHAYARPSEDNNATCERCAQGHFPTALVSELLAIQKKIGSLTDEQKEALARAAEQYKQDTKALRSGAPLDKVKCPFDENGRCLLGEAKPLSALFGPGLTNETALPCEIGHAIALRNAGLDYHKVEIGLALTKLLKNPSWQEAYARGEHCFWEEARIAPFRDAIAEQCRQMDETNEPTGAPPRDQLVIQAESIEGEAGVEASINSLPQDTVLRRVLHLRIPSAVQSEEEIDEFRSRFSTRLREFVTREEDPVEVFDAWRHFHLFPLAYHGREVKSILDEVGRTLLAPVTAKATPDLVELIEPRKQKGRIKVGYIGANLRYHNGGYWALGWLRNHPPDFETHVFSIRPINDGGSYEFRQAADHYYEIPGEVPSMARFIKSLNLDVLIFTDIGMDLPTSLFASMRLASVQATAWGHPVTSGIPTIDYYLSSEWMEPENGQDHYTEKLVRLPQSGLYLEPSRDTPSDKTRADFGLPEGFLAIVPQNPMKLIPREDALFAELSQNLKNPILFLEGKMPWANRIIRERLNRAGVRATWLPFQTHRDFLALLKLADVSVDVPAWNGGNTTLHAIQLGKPVISMPGEFMRGRHGLAFLRQAGVDSLIARDPNAFIALVQDHQSHSKAMSSANLEGPFHSLRAVEGLNEWIRKVTT